MRIVTVQAPVNIAVIKYWGKRDEELILPTNDSLSASLDTAVMSATTSACAAATFTRDRMWLNGEEQSFENRRLLNCLTEIKRRAREEKSVSDEFLQWKVHISSVNNFPTAAGLASSAAGYACLVSTLAKLYNITSEISSIARLGSGSACRSVYGGYVRWHAGVAPDGSDSVARPIAPTSHWPEMRILILVVNEAKKAAPSTKAMREIFTSELFEQRLKKLPAKVDRMVEAIKSRDFQTFGEITMRDSNQFHAVCLDTYPPFAYMNDVSHAIVRTIHANNDACGKIKAAYTCDAGPNVCLYLLEQDVANVLSVLEYTFPTSDGIKRVTGLEPPQYKLDLDFLSNLKVEKQELDKIKYIIYNKIGEGPSEVDGQHLLDENGSPVHSVTGDSK